MTTMMSSLAAATPESPVLEDVPPELRRWVGRRPKCISMHDGKAVLVGRDGTELVVLKCLYPDPGMGPVQARGLLEEARRTKRLHCTPKVREIVDTLHNEGGKPTGTIAFVMDYVNGGSLNDLLHKLDFHLPPIQVLNWSKQLALLLISAHERDSTLICDLRLANIGVQLNAASDGWDQLWSSKLVILDVELARPLGLGELDIGTAGTRAYMSPQRIAGLSPTIADDIYAFGVVMRQLLTGDTADTEPTRRSHLCPPVIYPLFSRFDIPPEWCELISRCVAENPEDRPETAGEIFDTLRRVKLPALC